MTDLEGRSLDEAIARAMGLGDLWDASEAVREGNRFHASLDALLRDIEPVCRERGMRRVTINCSDEDWLWEAFVDWSNEDNSITSIYRYAPTAATALARAFLAVLTRGEMYAYIEQLNQ